MLRANQGRSSALTLAKNMKFAYLTLLLFVSVLRAEVTTAMHDEFLSRLKATANSHEDDRYLTLLCANGLSPEMLKAAKMATEYNLSEIQKYGDAVTFLWSQPSPEMKKGIMEANGFRYTSNLKIEDVVILSWHDTQKNNQARSSLAVGVKDGKLLLVGTIKEPITQK